MDVKIIKSVTFEQDDRFLRASPQELLTMEYRLSSGHPIRAIAEDGKLKGFRATDANGNRVRLFSMTIYGSKRCFLLTCDDKTGECKAVEIDCSCKECKEV